MVTATKTPRGLYVGSDADTTPHSGKEARSAKPSFRLPTPRVLLSAAFLTGTAGAALAADEPPREWPPQVQMLSPSAPLDAKSKHGIVLAKRYAARPVMPAPGPDGEVRFLYGATEPTIVCAPLHLCNLALQPGEIVTKIDIGDSTMWQVTPAISGTGENQVTHAIIKPADAGLNTTLDIETSRRSYAIGLVSTRQSYMRKIAFDYPSDQASQWAAYQQEAGSQQQKLPADGYIRYTISGDDPPWKPITAYSDGKKTYIQFPPAMAYGKAPVLERLP